jgi:hypothetical protein
MNTCVDVAKKRSTTRCGAVLTARALSAEADSRKVKSFEVSSVQERSSGISAVAMVQKSTQAMREKRKTWRVERRMSINKFRILEATVHVFNSGRKAFLLFLARRAASGSYRLGMQKQRLLPSGSVIANSRSPQV